MKYDNIHQRYDLPLGLQFSLHFNKVEYPNKWITISNIPALNWFVYEGIETKEEILELLQYVIDTFDAIDYNLTNNKAVLNISLNEIQNTLFIKIVERYNTKQHIISKPLDEV